MFMTITDLITGTIVHVSSHQPCTTHRQPLHGCMRSIAAAQRRPPCADVRSSALQAAAGGEPAGGGDGGDVAGGDVAAVASRGSFRTFPTRLPSTSATFLLAFLGHGIEILSHYKRPPG